MSVNPFRNKTDLPRGGGGGGRPAAVLPNRSKGSRLLQDSVSLQLFGFADFLDSKAEQGFSCVQTS